MRQVIKCDLTYVVDNVERVSALTLLYVVEATGIITPTLEVP